MTTVTLVTGLILASGLIASAASAPVHSIARERRDDPSLPIAIPETLPDGYQYLGLGRVLQDPAGNTEAASWVYGARHSYDLPTVEICITERSIDHDGFCTFAGAVTLRTDPHTPAASATTSIITMTPAEEEDSRPWIDVQLTSDWEHPTWTRNG